MTDLAAPTASATSSAVVYTSEVEVQQFLADHTIATVEQIAADNLERLALVDPEDPNFDRARAIAALQGGVWYSTEYIAAFRKVNAALQKIDLPFTLKEIGSLPPIANLKYISKGNAPQKYFDSVGVLMWRVKDDVSASDAIDAALNGPTLTDCGGTCNLARHIALRDFWGKARYDAIFKGRVFLGYPRIDYLDVFVDFAQPTNKGTYQIRRGAKVLFCNHPSYGLKHPCGTYQASHMVYAGKRKYVSIRTPGDGLTKEEVVRFLRDEFNKPIDHRLGGLVSNEEFTQLIDKGQKFLTDNVQIQTEDVPGLQSERIEEFTVATIMKLLQINVADISDATLSEVCPVFLPTQQAIEDGKSNNF
jgi:hypothetical protein